MGEIAPTVLMPGDPLRARWIAQTFLQEAECVSDVRGMLCFTGKYRGKSVSVMGHGMGMPSIGIYSHELFCFYGVQTVLRVGSAGGMAEDLHIHDIVLAMGACTDSAYAAQFRLPGTFAPIADFDLLRSAASAAQNRGLPVKIGNVVSSDVFYRSDSSVHTAWRDMGVLAVEMETAALYMEAAAAGKKALSLLTVSDHLFREGALSPLQRQTGFNDMIALALDLI